MSAAGVWSWEVYISATVHLRTITSSNLQIFTYVDNLCRSESAWQSVRITLCVIPGLHL